MRNKRGTCLMAVGGLLLAGALLLTASNFREERQADRLAGETVKILIQQVIPELPGEAVSEPVAAEIQSVTIKGDDYIGVLEIPSLGLSLPVMDSWSYPALKKSPCRYAGSYLNDDMIIAGHNYKRHFGTLNRLEPGNQVTFTDVSGFVYQYRVLDVETLAGSDRQDMEAGSWDLTLFTCTYGGKNRVTVRCERYREDAPPETDLN